MKNRSQEVLSDSEGDDLSGRREQKPLDRERPPSAYQAKQEIQELSRNSPKIGEMSLQQPHDCRDDSDAERDQRAQHKQRKLRIDTKGLRIVNVESLIQQHARHCQQKA